MAGSSSSESLGVHETFLLFFFLLAYFLGYVTLYSPFLSCFCSSFHCAWLGVSVRNGWRDICVLLYHYFQLSPWAMNSGVIIILLYTYCLWVYFISFSLLYSYAKLDRTYGKLLWWHVVISYCRHLLCDRTDSNLSMEMYHW